MSSTVPRSARWACIFTFAGICALSAWTAGKDLSSLIEAKNLDIAARRQEPLPNFPRPPITEVVDFAARYARDIDGIAVPYTAEADRLVLPDGEFKTDLTIEEAATILRMDPSEIAKTDGSLDPDATLFLANSGILTPEAKRWSRAMRAAQATKGEKPWQIYFEFTVTEYRFMLNKLKNPSQQERVILAAISRAARLILPKPGEGILAVGVNRGEFEHRSVITGGMLPLEDATKN